MERPDGCRVADVAEREQSREVADSTPAPPDADVRGPTVVCRFDERACDHRRAGDTAPVLTLQPWTPRGAAATYVAWAVDDCGGEFGIFDARTERLLLGEGTPAGRRWHPVVETGPASGVLADATPALRPSVPRATATASESPPLDPKPGDAAEAGETQAYTLSSWTRPVTAFVQPWRPLNGGAVYLACRIDDPHERFSYHGWFGVLDDGVLRLGRRPAPAFVAIDIESEEAATLAEDVRALAPERTTARAVSEVLDVREARE